jgi:FkbM family methyltransferase
VLRPLLQRLPLVAFVPFRRGAALLPRGSFARNVCIALLKAALKYRKIADELEEIRPLDDPTVSFIACDSMVMDDVYWFGLRGYEGMLVDVWGGLVGRSQGVLEVGGNIGFYSVIGGRRMSGKYLVVEPIAENAKILRGNLLRNGIMGVEVKEAAVIADFEPCRVQLNIPDEGRGSPVGAHLVVGVEGIQRSTLRVIEVEGLPIRELAKGCDLIKIDAEGIEAELISALRPQILAEQPTLVVEVLPEAHGLATVLRELAETCGYLIHVVPAWGTQQIVTVPADKFSASTPQAHNSKDVILAMRPLSELLQT